MFSTILEKIFSVCFRGRSKEKKKETCSGLRRVQLRSRHVPSDCRTRELDLQDQISRLPDEVLALMLSFLPLTEAVRTSILSSHWVHLWKFTPLLDFDPTKALIRLAHNKRSDKEENAKYIKWVNQVLLSDECCLTVLEEFRVCFDLSKDYQNEIDDWLIFALTRKVQKLELDLRGPFIIRYFDSCYTFPLFVGESSSPPKLINGRMFSCAFGCSESLKELSLASVNVSAEVIQHFLSNCPLLERLVVIGSGQLRSLEVSGPSLNLKYLEISYCYNLDFFKICNTNLISVKGYGIPSCILLNNPSLVEACLCYTVLVAAFFPKPSSVLSQLEFLHLRTEFRMKDSMLRGSPRLPRLKQLKVTFIVHNNDESVMGFSHLVKAAPSLQKFVMEFHNYRLARNLFRRVEKHPTCPHHQLKIVELKGYDGGDNNLEVLVYFLENALALEELVIDPRNPSLTNPMLKRRDTWMEEEEAARMLSKKQIEEISHLVSHVKVSIL